MYRLLALLPLIIGSAAAGPITLTGITFESTGNLFKHGSIYIESPSASNGFAAQGVGKVSEIVDDVGTILWSSGDNGVDLLYEFNSFERTSNTLIGSTNVYGDVGGLVNMYVSPTGLFTPTGNYVVDVDVMNNGSLFLSMEGVLNSNGYSVEGIETPTANSGNALLAVTGGEGLSYFDTNTLEQGADMYFNFSADVLATAGYDYSGSGDLSAYSVPVPTTAVLMSMGLLLLGTTIKLKT